MSLLSLIFSLLLEQARPLPETVWASRGIVARYAAFIEQRFNAGEVHHGMIGWLVAVLPPVLIATFAYYLLFLVQPLLALAWNILVLYLTMGFRQVSHYFSETQQALQAGELERARERLGSWRARLSDRLSSSEVARVSIEEALLASHRHVFAVVLWFILLPGPSGAVLYRLANHLARDWGGRSDAEFGAFGQFARKAFEIIDWLPARCTAFAFSIVGDFEDAIYCWRTQAARWPDLASGILISSGAGALGVRLGMPLHDTGEVVERPEMGLGDDADADFMQSAIGLIWRTLVLFLLLLALLWVSSWVGG
ncbi:MAG: CobD/CbiB family protein [Sterolibacteriaceae bacterium]|uniref:Cobalamin biosynthesis protein CobD n=1 Tax=Candidatus Methylophosphatis roskildensis TaxID=2899263 RepID=A0A9D7E2R1_9PROT|nr:CobD/CbiB family protein [Candidatus Methylophosphatis roskildensis]MBK7235477.1 CobD/CbiB family protein [Sterolibacteriaceae bacterium]